MRILHTSDWHLGLNLYSTSLQEDQNAFVDEILKIIKDKRVGAVIIAGDIFDRAVVSSGAIDIYNRAMTQICIGLQTPVIMIAGNHDGAARLASCTQLLEKAGLYVTGKLRREGIPVIIGDTAFYCIPYFSIDEVRYLFPEEEITSYSQAMEKLTQTIRKNFLPGKKHVLIAHCFSMGGQLSDSDRSAAVGGALAVDTDAFRGFDYVALGHLHRAQNLGPQIRYSGAPLKYSFEEAKQKKSVTIWDSETMKIEEVPIRPLHDLKVVRGEYESLLIEAQTHPGAEEYIKVELTDSYAGLEKLDAFRACYPNLLALTGKSYEAEEKMFTLTAKEAATFSEEEILLRFYEEIAGGRPEKEMLDWFHKAQAAIEKGELQ
ncbi:exonuclease SbcCD subunit D [Youxingia wuxianensis]|uniref:Nuclease SbcCD subunit D n=1 Tax=Youxingia wuxianensis TaxID=2763678 RepID=A0A926IGL0_9FIRM|nr:exonuclease SbcCD subunit D [Youxingia wuxianensis]MBC8584984.1 exonuclease SbcCD subunit D [Youxingia wuxianensis]